MIDYSNADPAALAEEAEQAIANFDIGDAERLLHDIDRTFRRTRQQRCEGAHEALRHLGDRNYGKARQRARELVAELTAKPVVLAV